MKNEDCNCTQAEFLRDENQWEPFHMCESCYNKHVEEEHQIWLHETHIEADINRLTSCLDDVEDDLPF